MEIILTMEQQAQLSNIAALEGKDADVLEREDFLRGLQPEASFVASRPGNREGRAAAARMLEQRQGNMLPEGVTIQDLMREGRA